MPRLIVLIAIVAALILSGCEASPRADQPSPSPRASAEPTASLRAIHRDNFVRVDVAVSYGHGDRAVMNVSLKRLGPAHLLGRTPYKDLALLMSLEPGLSSYTVALDDGGDGATFVWRSSGQLQLVNSATGRIGQFANDISTGTIAAVANGDQPLPELMLAR